MKCRSTFFGLLFFLVSAFTFQVGEAKSSVTDVRNPLGDMAIFESIYVAPFNFPAEMDDMARLKVQLLIQDEFSKAMIPMTWPDSQNYIEIPESASHIGIMDVRVGTYGWSNYWTEGYYEDYYDVEYYDTWVSEAVYKDGKYAGERKRLIRVERPVVRTRYVEPQYIEQALAQITFTLKDPESGKILWFYNQNRLDTKGTFRSAPTPDKSIKTIAEEAAKAMNKRIQEDKKKQ